VAEGARSHEDAASLSAAERRRAKARTPEEKEYAKLRLGEIESEHAGNTLRLAKQLEGLTGLEARVTILGYVQRGGTPSYRDRLLATRLGTACVDLIAGGAEGIMVAARGHGIQAVPIASVAGKLKLVPSTIPGSARPARWARAWATDPAGLMRAPARLRRPPSRAI